MKDEPYAAVLAEQLHRELSTFNLELEVVEAAEGSIAEAVSASIAETEGDIVGVMNGTGTHKPAVMSKMLLKLLMNYGYTDVVVGERVQNNYPFFRRAITFFSSWFTRLVLGLSYRDPLTAVVVGKREAMKYESFKGCKFALEILSGVPRGRVETVGYIHEEREGHKSKMRWREILYLFRQLWRLRRER